MFRPDIYSLSNLRHLLEKPSRLIRVVNYILVQLNCKYHSNFYSNNGFNIMNEDWDMLFILDGCRYDIFKCTWNLDNTVEKRKSVGSCTPEFLIKTFSDKQYHDTVYLTANPYVAMLSEDTFHSIEILLKNEWDEKLGTVPPSAMVEAVMDTREEYPQKRILAHFMQPHFPFIGDQWQEEETASISNMASDGTLSHPSDEHTIWNKLQFNLADVSKEDVLKGYQENLELVIDEILDITDDLDGKLAISSDHGNLIGDRVGPLPSKGYGHPCQLYSDELVNVPWVEMEIGDRWRISSDPPVESPSLRPDTLIDRLNKLGYK